MAKAFSYLLMGIGAVGASTMHLTLDTASAANSDALQLVAQLAPPAPATPGSATPAPAPAQTPTSPSSIKIPKLPVAPSGTPPRPSATPQPAAQSAPPAGGMTEAQKTAVLDKVRTYLRRPDVANAKQAVMKQQAPLVFGDCPSMTFRSTRLTILAMPSFDNAGVMRSGAVRETWTGAGCPNRSPVLNLWVYGQRENTPAVAASFPGSSIADPRLQRDFLVTAMSAAGIAVPSCKKFDVTDTRFGAFEGTAPKVQPGRDARMWREDWVLRGCDKTVKVVMHFAPDATGTGGRVLPSETQLIAQ